MAGASGQKKDTMALEIFHIFVVINAFHRIYPTVAVVETHGQAFIQTDNELRYMVDGVPLHVVPSSANIQDLRLQDGSMSASPIRFEPDMLDFKEQPVGMPQVEQVSVYNPDEQNSLHLLSISGSTLHFHCSFFQDKLVPPGGNTTFEVVFLARLEGNVENTLYIHTSAGSFKYKVIGIGVANPYRVRPFLGAKVPLNTSFSHLIRMHNPHNYMLQVEEIYTSGGDLHLELPTGEQEALKDMWEIPPYETKPIMKASFIGRLESNHTAFIRIRTNREHHDRTLVLPVEVEVTSAPGLFSPVELLDFGLLRTRDEPKLLRLNLINSASKPIHVTNISVSPANSAISIEFRPVQLKPDILRPTTVALISFTASKALSHHQWSGTLVIRSSDRQYRVVIPYQASIMHGRLEFDPEKTTFYTGNFRHENITNFLALHNAFNCTVVIYNVTISPEARLSFSINKFDKPIAIAPDQMLDAFALTFNPNASNLHFTTSLLLHTNASTFAIPLRVYNGGLKVVHHHAEIFKGRLDFGTMGIGERRNMTFTIRNENPVDITIKEFAAKLSGITVILLGVEQGNGTTLTREHNMSAIRTSPLVLKPHHFAVFNVNLVAPEVEGSYTDEVTIATQFQNLFIPVTLRTVKGSLNAVPHTLVLDHCFPGKQCSQNLRLRSTFDHIMEVRDVHFRPNDTRFFYVPPSGRKSIFIESQNDNLIGKIYFNMKTQCMDDCYVGLPTYIPAGHHWLLGATLDKDVADTDQYLYTRFRHKWHLLGQTQHSTINMTLQVDTDDIRGFLFPTQVHLHWPVICRRTRINFPLTQIGNISVSSFEVENPSDMPVMVQVLPLYLYPNPQMILDMLATGLLRHITDQVETDESDVFLLADLDKTNVPLLGVHSATTLRRNIENSLGVRPHRRTIAAVMPPRSKLTIRVGFRPNDDASHTSLLLIRNNLTVVDAVVVQGQGGRGELRFGNRHPSSSTPLQFDLTEKHLRNCDKRKQSKNIPPNFTVRRTFTARNVGQLPFYVTSFHINDVTCEGYGFKVLDCEGFELPPNSSRKVDLAFTPDFSMSRVRRMLRITTSLAGDVSSANFSLHASVPPALLARCRAALPRPVWEPLLYTATLAGMSVLLVGVLVAAYLEADRVIATSNSKRRGRVHVFDLNAIAKQQLADVEKTSVEKTAAEKTSSAVKAADKSGVRHWMTCFVSWWKSPEVLDRPKVPKVAESEVSSVGSKLTPITAPPVATDKSGRKTKTTRPMETTRKQKTNETKAAEGKTKAEKKTVTQQKKDAKVPDVSSDTVVGGDDYEEEKEAMSKEAKRAKAKGEEKRRRLIELDHEETSSTTTESSGVDADDKMLVPRDLTPDRQLPPAQPPSPTTVTLSGGKPAQKQKRRNKKERRRTVANDNETIVDEINDDSASAAKAKTKSVNAEAKNITASASSEPTLDTVAAVTTKSDDITRIESSKDTLQSTSLLTSGPSQTFTPTVMKKHTKAKRGGKERTAELRAPSAKQARYVAPPRLQEGDTRVSDSPPPLWDTPQLGLPSGDLAELSLQTEQFAARHQVKLAPPPPPPPPRLCSYSSAVSSSPPLQVTSTPHTGVPLQAVVPPRTAIANNEPGLAVSAGELPPHPGVVGMKMKPSKAVIGAPRRPPPWNTPILTRSPSVPDPSSLRAMKEAQKGVGTIIPPDCDPEVGSRSSSTGPFGGNNSIFGHLNDNIGQFGFANNSVGSIGHGAATPDTMSQLSMMQKLQLERRQRLLQYQHKLQTEEWPGFGISPLPQDSLWDNSSMTPSAEAWSICTDSPPRPKPNVSMWEGTGQSVPSPPLTSWPPNPIWGGPPPSPELMPESNATSIEQPPPATFDPFNTIGNIWNPTSGASGGSGGNSAWGFLPKPRHMD